ncbi:MAG: FtsX-like permease family protein [Planctomycetota bacterium]|nr:FtsX-like permease family protein [Planctomycetota bacterium]
MYRWFLSLRYLRARRTNWIGVAGIFVAVAALILIMSIMAGFLNESRSHLRGNLADVLVLPRMEYYIDGPNGMPMRPRTDPGPLLEIVRAQPGVASACVQLQWYGLLLVENQTEVMENPLHGDVGLVSLLGIDVEDEFTTSDLRDNLLSVPPKSSSVRMEYVDDIEDPFAPPLGYDPPGNIAPSVLLGAQLGTSLGLFKGDEVTIVTSSILRQDRDGDDQGIGTPSNMRFVVAGFFRTGENEMDLERVYFERDVLASFLAKSDVGWSQAMVRLEDYERDHEQVVAGIHSALHEAGYLHHPDADIGKGEVVTWEAFRGNLLGAIENEKSLMRIMLMLVMLVAGFTIFAIHSMLVTEKRRDIGILCALGATPRGIMTTFVLIACWEVIFGATLGVAAGIVAAWNIDPFERWLSNVFGLEIFDRQVYLFDHIPSAVEVWGVVGIVAWAVGFTMVFSALPALRAARLNPIDALRNE